MFEQPHSPSIFALMLLKKPLRSGYSPFYKSYSFAVYYCVSHIVTRRPVLPILSINRCENLSGEAFQKTLFAIVVQGPGSRTLYPYGTRIRCRHTVIESQVSPPFRFEVIEKEISVWRGSDGNAVLIAELCAEKFAWKDHFSASGDDSCFSIVFNDSNIAEETAHFVEDEFPNDDSISVEKQMISTFSAFPPSKVVKSVNIVELKRKNNFAPKFENSKFSVGIFSGSKKWTFAGHRIKCVVMTSASLVSIRVDDEISKLV